MNLLNNSYSDVMNSGSCDSIRVDILFVFTDGISYSLYAVNDELATSTSRYTSRIALISFDNGFTLTEILLSKKLPLIIVKHTFLTHLLHNLYHQYHCLEQPFHQLRYLVYIAQFCQIYLQHIHQN